jgi:ATP adenylyltransferase/5',5'''-P-1,P-4-tetraphosphate phosphorylase II
MVIVPRSKNLGFRRFGLNALAYIGIIFVKSEENFVFLSQTGPLDVLADAGISHL